jgi:hypothetical protein
MRNYLFIQILPIYQGNMENGETLSVIEDNETKILSVIKDNMKTLSVHQRQF